MKKNEKKLQKKSAKWKMEYLCIFGHNSVIFRVTKMIFTLLGEQKEQKETKILM